MRRLFLPALGAALLTGCMQAPPAPALTTEESSVPSVEEEIGDRMPENSDSLEVSTEATVDITAITGGVLLGDPSAPTLTVFTDDNCEYCRTFLIRDLPALEDALVSTKRLSIRLLFLPQSSTGRFMATQALCAASADRFREAQSELLTGTVSEKSSLKTLASIAGLSQKNLQSCLKDPQWNAALETVKAEAESHGLTRVPSFVLGETSWVGLLPEDELIRRIEEGVSR